MRRYCCSTEARWFVQLYRDKASIWWLLFASLIVCQGIAWRHCPAFLCVPLLQQKPRRPCYATEPIMKTYVAALVLLVLSGTLSAAGCHAAVDLWNATRTSLQHAHICLSTTPTPSYLIKRTCAVGTATARVSQSKTASPPSRCDPRGFKPEVGKSWLYLYVWAGMCFNIAPGVLVVL